VRIAWRREEQLEMAIGSNPRRERRSVPSSRSSSKF
jgi:hypothetical protein